MLHLGGKEIQHVVGDQVGAGVRRAERGVTVRTVGRHDRHDLLRRAPEIGRSDPVRWPEDLDGLAVGRKLGAVVDVVHAFEFGRLPGVHLQDDTVGLVDPGLVVADGGRRDQLAVGRDPRHLDDREVEVSEKAFPHHLGDMREVYVEVIHQPGVDLGPADRIRLVGHPQLDAVDGGQGTVELGRRRRTGPDADLETVTAGGRFADPLDQSGGHGLGIAGPGESAQPNIRAGRNQRCGLLRGHHLPEKCRALDTRLVCHRSHAPVWTQPVGMFGGRARIAPKSLSVSTRTRR